MTDDFKRFVDTIRNGIRIGEIRITKELTDFDLAVQYAIGKIGEAKGYPCDISPEEIVMEIERFAPELV